MIQHRYTITTDATHEIEELIARFERDRGAGPVELTDYLPQRDDVAYAAMVTELARIDLEHGFEGGDTPKASDHINAYPEVFQQHEHYRAQLAFEEYRLRRRAGEDVDSIEIGSEYKVDGSHWPRFKLGVPERENADPSSRRFGKEELAIRITRYPKVGDTFSGYPLIQRLGEGAFSRVFLARQPDLAGRSVVLKVTPVLSKN